MLSLEEQGVIAEKEPPDDPRGSSRSGTRPVREIMIPRTDSVAGDKKRTVKMTFVRLFKEHRPHPDAV